MKAIILSVVDANVAANGPTGVAYHIHQIVDIFHSANAKDAQPNTRHHDLRELS